MKKIIMSVFSFIFTLCLSGCSKDSTSIGVIGGADGPTAISVTSGISRLSICGFIAILVVTVLVMLIIYRNKKKK